MENNDCPFCSSEQRYRDIAVGNHVRVMYPKNPSCAYHALIIPLRHVETFDQLTTDEVVELHYFVKLLHSVVSTNVGNDYIGYNLLANNGGAAVNQHVMHSHMHVYNRTAQDPNDPVKTHKKDKVYMLTEEETKNMRTLQEWVRRASASE